MSKNARNANRAALAVIGGLNFLMSAGHLIQGSAHPLHLGWWLWLMLSIWAVSVALGTIEN